MNSPSGGARANENAFAVDFPVHALQAWVSPQQHNIVSHNGKPHHVVVVADKDIQVVNKGGDSSVRGGLLARKLYNPETPTKDRLNNHLFELTVSYNL